MAAQLATSFVTGGRGPTNDKHAPRLRQLVDRGLAYKTSYWCNARITLHFESCIASHVIVCQLKK